MIKHTESRGRPAIGPRIEVRLTEGQLAELDRRAKHLGLRRPEWIRNVVAEALSRPFKPNRTGGLR